MHKENFVIGNYDFECARETKTEMKVSVLFDSTITLSLCMRGSGIIIFNGEKHSHFDFRNDNNK
jgi:hypothetical protein